MAEAALRLIGRTHLRERFWDEQKLTLAERAEARVEPEGLGRTMGSLKRLALRARQRV